MDSGHQRRFLLSVTAAWLGASTGCLAAMGGAGAELGVVAGGIHGAFAGRNTRGPEGGGVAPSAPTSSYLEIIEAEPQEIGDYPIGSRIHRKVRVRNISASTVKLRQHSATCSCLDSVIEPPELAPGQAGVVTLRAMAGGAPGEQELTVTFAVSPVVGAGGAAKGAGKGPSERVAMSMRFRCTAEFYCPMSEFRLFGLAGRPVEASLYVQMAPTAADSKVLASWDRSIAGPSDVVASACDGASAKESAPAPSAVVSDPVDPAFSIRTVRISLPGLSSGSADGPALPWPALRLHGRGAETPQSTLPVVVTAMMHWSAVVISDTVARQDGAQRESVAADSGAAASRCVSVRLTPSPLARSCQEGPSRPTRFRVRTLGGSWTVLDAGAVKVSGEGPELTASLDVGTVNVGGACSGEFALVIEGLDEPGNAVARVVAMPGVGGPRVATGTNQGTPRGQR